MAIRHAWHSLLFGSCLLVVGCAVDRRVLSVEELETKRVAYEERVERDRAEVIAKLVQRWEKEFDDHAAGRSVETPHADTLVLSGGGDYGAFGAGFLQGWGDVRAGPLSRPREFDTVTGVSTGALIAPFAFIGDEEAYREVTRLYREPKEDWVKLDGMLFFLPGRASFLNTQGLQRDICTQIGPGVVARIAEGHAQHRVLAIGTTDLDLGVTTAWNLTREADDACRSGDCSRVHKVLLASAAIPAAFPPVVIDDTLYVDGGTSSNILYSAEMLSNDTPRREWRRRHPDRPLPKMRFWVIINNQLHAAPQAVQPNWPSITTASVSTAIRSSTLGSLRFLALQAEHIRRTEHLDIEMYYVAIPDDWRAPKPGIFVKETMDSLADLGFRMGRDPASWKRYEFDVTAPLDPFTRTPTQDQMPADRSREQE
ncbi:MAG: patatin-like phospholipase family protein [Phycisphaerales bacterium]|nr:patatin-like phospholipase family protein [Phycisphaerales bacterium]